MALSDLTRGGRDPAAQYQRMTETPVSRLVLTLAVPTVISMLITNIYNLVDTAFVGMLGNSASGAVGIVFGYMAILQSFGFMYGQGGGSVTTGAGLLFVNGISPESTGDSDEATTGPASADAGVPDAFRETRNGESPG